MARKTDSFSGILLQISLGVFFAINGIQGISQYDANASNPFRPLLDAVGRSQSPIDLVIAIVYLVAGVLLVLGLFLRLKRTTHVIFGFVLTGIWFVQILYRHIIYNLGEPSVLVWLSRLSIDIVILAVLWLITNRREQI